MDAKEQKATDALDRVLQQLGPDEVDAYLDTYTDSLVHEEHPFSGYLRARIREKGLTQREVFERADLPDRYGYRLLTQEKNTKQRDYILRLCFGAKLSLQETQRALKLYGMSELYARIPRDAVLMIALNREVYEIDKVNALLAAHDMAPLKSVSYVG